MVFSHWENIINMLKPCIAFLYVEISQMLKEEKCLCADMSFIFSVRGYNIIQRHSVKLKIHLDPEPEKAMTTHSSILAWKIPWTKEPGRLQSMGSLRVEHDWPTSLSLFTFMHWTRKWQPTPVFLPGESQGRGSLVGCCLWGYTELDTTEAT